MDIKAPLESKRYSEISGVKVNLSNIKKSIKIIMDSSIDYEFRTTVIPNFLNDDDILKISNQIKGASKYYLQQFDPENVFNKKLKKIKPYPQEWFAQIAKKIKGLNIEIRC